MPTEWMSLADSGKVTEREAGQAPVNGTAPVIGMRSSGACSENVLTRTTRVGAGGLFFQKSLAPQEANL
jgi:hypothetical protein